jgi:hypothetical protein
MPGSEPRITTTDRGTPLTRADLEYLDVVIRGSHAPKITLAAERAELAGEPDCLQGRFDVRVGP